MKQPSCSDRSIQNEHAPSLPQTFLCLAQCWRWHSRLQYRAYFDVQRAHRLHFSATTTWHCEQAFIFLPRASISFCVSIVPLAFIMGVILETSLPSASVVRIMVQASRRRGGATRTEDRGDEDRATTRRARDELRAASDARGASRGDATAATRASARVSKRATGRVQTMRQA